MNQKGGIPRGFSFILLLLVIFAVVGTFRSVTGHASTKGGDFTSGIKGICLDDYHSNEQDYAIVDSYSCNNTEAQAWQLDGLTINHANMCMTLDASSKVDLQTCTKSANQIWLRDNVGFLNPNSGLCLSIPKVQTGKQLVGATCSQLNTPSETWGTSSAINCQANTPGQKIACSAVNQWTAWNANGANHEALLNTYTDGAAYEEWCADFVSYVYLQAGYPFQNGEASGWDESNANNIQSQGFTMHSPNGYTPQPGDVAYFSYNGGHVEIVVSGGSHPTFIYGNSGTIDPSTGNGEMAANTLTQVAGEGQLLYYLSPNI